MGRAARRKKTRTTVEGPLAYTGQADQLAGARWARRSPEALVFFTLPWTPWLSAAFMLAVAAWTMISAWLEQNLFGIAGLLFVGFAGWLVHKAPRERTSLDRQASVLRIEEGVVRLRTVAEVPFADIHGFAIEVARRRGLYRVVAVVDGGRWPLGRSFLFQPEAEQRVQALAGWLTADEPPVDVRLEEDAEDEE